MESTSFSSSDKATRYREALDQLEALWAVAEVKPAFVQNRCYARDGWDREVRAWCLEHGVRYQAFSLLTANRAELESTAVQAVAKRHGKSVAEVVFAFARQLGLIVLTGTSSEAHMRADLAAASITLDAHELHALGA